MATADQDGQVSRPRYTISDYFAGIAKKEEASTGSSNSTERKRKQPTADENNTSESVSPLQKIQRQVNGLTEQSSEKCVLCTASSNCDDVMLAIQLLKTPERKKLIDKITIKAESAEDTRLARVWQWNQVTGDPIFEDATKKWQRYVPESFCEPSNLARSEMSKQDKKILSTFVTGMQSNEDTFTVSIYGGQTRHNNETTLLRRILATDMKKIRLTRTSGNGVTRIKVKKTADDLKPYPTPDPGLPSSQGLRAQKLMDLVNKNAKYGNYGPGSFWCRSVRCTLRDNMTAAAVVDFGGDNKIVLNKRFSCCTPNIIYALHCDVCRKDKSYAIHVGSTKNLNKRLQYHLDGKQSSKCAGGQKYNTEEIQDFIASHTDPDQFRRDSCVHFSFEHSQAGLEIAKVTILHKLAETEMKNKRKLEDKYKNETGAYNYKGLGRGGLNSHGG